jgi:hypothetical protein
MAELPKQELLIKLLGMTTAGDNEALVAIRKANALLTAAGWSWEQLIRGKITIVEDPFNSIDNLFEVKPTATAAPTPPRRPQAPTPSKPAPVDNPFMASPRTRIGIAPNKFLARCYCCGVEVVTGAGFWFRPNALNPAAPDKISVVCTPCSTTGTVYRAATGQRPTKKRGSVDIHNLI